MPVPVLTYDELTTELKSYHERGDGTSDQEFFDQLPKSINSAERRIAIDLKIQGIGLNVTTSLVRGTNTIAKPDLWRSTISVMARLPVKVYSVVSRNSSGFVRTLVTSRAHGFVAGQSVVVSNVNGSYDGEYTIVSVTQKNIVYSGATSVTESSTAVADGYVASSQFVSRPLFPRSLEYCNTYWPNSNLFDLPKFYADYGSDHWLIAPPPKYQIGLEIAYYGHHPFLESTNQTNWLSENLPDLLRYFAIAESAIFLRKTDIAGVYMGKYSELLKSLDAEEVSKIADRSSHRKRA